jgi:hypothetical protein
MKLVAVTQLVEALRTLQAGSYGRSSKAKYKILFSLSELNGNIYQMLWH